MPGSHAPIGIGMVPVELMFGILVSMINIAIQSLVSVGLIRFMRKLRRRSIERHRVAALAGAMMATGALLTFSHMMQVWVWAQAYNLIEAVKPGDAYYFAFVNFTTLGYGDLVPAPRWRVIGPITAANGMLLFGMSTALIFAVLTRAATVLHVYDPPPRAPSRRRKPSGEASGRAAEAPGGDIRGASKAEGAGTP